MNRSKIITKLDWDEQVFMIQSHIKDFLRYKQKNTKKQKFRHAFIIGGCLGRVYYTMIATDLYQSNF